MQVEKCCCLIEVKAGEIQSPHYALSHITNKKQKKKLTKKHKKNHEKGTLKLIPTLYM